MQVKKFEAPTIQEALDAVKRELGPEAIILATKKHKKGFGLMSKASVEITAAVSERSIQKKQYTDVRLPEPTREAVQKLPAARQADVYDRALERTVGQTRDQVSLRGKAPAKPKGLTATRYIDIEDDAGEQARHFKQVTQPPAVAKQKAPAGATATGPASALQDEVKHLKRMIEDLKVAQDTHLGLTGSGAQALMANSSLGSPALQDAFEHLLVNGIDKRYALQMMRAVAFEVGATAVKNPDAVMDELASELVKATHVFAPLRGLRPNSSETGDGRPTVWALVGPTGVGKTTTLAKLASLAKLNQKLRVGLINLDSYKINAFEQLATYAKILGVPFRSAGGLDDLKVALEDFKALDLILIDTTGRSPKDPESIAELQSLLKSIADVKTALVVSATTRDTEVYELTRRFGALAPQGIIVSKLDEATVFGSLFNVSAHAKLPLMYFTTGQRVPEDLEEASPERVAALVLDL